MSCLSVMSATEEDMMSLDKHMAAGKGEDTVCWDHLLCADTVCDLFFTQLHSVAYTCTFIV